MTGIRTVNNFAVFLYECLILCGIAGLAAYDLWERRVPNQILAVFCLTALPTPLIHSWPFMEWPLLLFFFLYFLMGAVLGFLVLLSAAMLSESGVGVGGGDIKLAAVMGFIYGPSRILLILLIASALASTTALIIRKQSKMKNLSLPFVPFLSVGSFAVTAVTFIR